MKIIRVVITTAVLVFGFIFLYAATIEVARSKAKYGNVPGSYKKKQDTGNISLYKASPAENASFLNKLNTLEAVFSKHPLMTGARGYNAYGTIYINTPENSGSSASKNGYPLTGVYSIVVRDFTDGPGNKMAEAIMGVSSVGIRVNSFGAVFSGLRIYLFGIGSDIYYQPRQLGTFQGHPIYNEDSNVFFFRSSTRPLWLPVSAGEFIDILIRRIEAERDETMKELKGKNLAPNDIYLKGKAERRKSFEEAYNMLKKMNPGEAEKARKEFEENEKRYAEEAATHHETSDDLRATQRKMFDDSIAALKAELASLSPSQRKAQAVYTGGSDERPSGLGGAGDENAKPVVRINTAYFDDGKPRDHVRCIAVQYDVNGIYNREEGTWSTDKMYLDAHVLHAMHATLDWKTILSLLGR